MPGPSRAGGAQPQGGRISRYEIVERLGGLALGPVYRAWDPSLERSVVVRLIPPGLAGRDAEPARLLRMARRCASLAHPNVCSLHEVGETGDGSFFLVSALCEGETLAQRLAQGPIRPEIAVDLAAQAAAGVAHAHERGIVHGRLRPSNVWIGVDGCVRVVDFGLAWLEERTWSRWEGKPPSARYLAPEQLQGEPASRRTDVWSLGVMLSEMAAGGVEAILERALAEDPADRYANAGELRQALRRLQGSDSTLSGTGSGSFPLPAAPRVPGRRLTHYRIGELLGSGGMGVVYRGEDIHLGRTVALKFLPAELAGDPAAKARFLQEARAASALDHPNICTVYEIGETEDRRLYLAMPCYDGEDLKQKIARGPLPVPEALDYACQVAAGLAKAHRQGIVHRDIKPANLMVTGDGLVKILDFGVAKLADDAGLTRTGAAVGTPAYMSPEQIRGEEVGPRTDLWSLGVVLYEMVTGRRPFPGQGSESIRHAVLTREPEPLARLRPDAPPELERVVRGLLAREPEDRCPTADSLAADLRLLQGMPANSGPVKLSAPRRRAKALRLGLAAALAAALAAVAAGLLLRQRPEAPVQATFARLTDQEGSELFPSLSPDGTFFVYAKLDGGDYDVFLQRVGGGNAINLTADSPADDSQPAYSPDGQRIAFHSKRDGGGLFVMGATGESVRRVTRFGYQPCWSPDGRQLAFATEAVRRPLTRTNHSELWRVEVATGRLHRVHRGDAVQPSWSPGGRRIAFWGIPDKGSRRVLQTVPAGGGQSRYVLNDGFVNWSPVWAPDGRHLYFVSDKAGSMNLWRVRLDERMGEVEGDPEPVTTPAQSVGTFSFSRDGRILFAADETRSNIERIEFDPAEATATGDLVPVTHNVRYIHAPNPSPDGQWIVMQNESPQEDLLVARMDGSGLRQLTDDSFRDRAPTWSPDGRWIYFSSDRGGPYEIWAIQPDGSSLHRVAGAPGAHLFEPRLSPDGRWLVSGLSTWGASLVDLSRPPGERAPHAIAVPGSDAYVFTAWSWSPDGKWLAGLFASRKAQKWVGMGLYSLESRSYQVLLERGKYPSLINDGQVLVYLDGGALHAFDRRTGKTKMSLAPPRNSQFVFLAPAGKGRVLYLLRVRDEGDVWILTPQTQGEKG